VSDGERLILWYVGREDGVHIPVRAGSVELHEGVLSYQHAWEAPGETRDYVPIRRLDHYRIEREPA